MKTLMAVFVLALSLAGAEAQYPQYRCGVQTTYPRPSWYAGGEFWPNGTNGNWYVVSFGACYVYYGSGWGNLGMYRFDIDPTYCNPNTGFGLGHHWVEEKDSATTDWYVLTPTYIALTMPAGADEAQWYCHPDGTLSDPFVTVWCTDGH